MPETRRGFTLIELLVVIVIIGILAALAIPRFAATKDKAKLASVKEDLHNVEVSQEAYFSDHATYGTLAQLKSANKFSLSSGNTMAISATTSGYTATATNSSISKGFKKCQVTVGRKASLTVDGVLTCS